MTYKEKLAALEKELKAIDFYIQGLKSNKVLNPTEIRTWEIKFRRTMIRHRTLIINNNSEAA